MPQIHEKEWQIAPQISAEADKNLAKYPPLLRQVLFNRGISDADSAKSFLGALAPENNDPFLLSGMQEAVGRLALAIENQEAIIIYGDYDADGVTATALLVHCLRSLGGKAKGYIPDRFTEGYGLNNGALGRLAKEGAKVVVTVDCGIRSLDEAKEAKKLGLDLIITDHHSVGPEIPDALAVINCKKAGELYENKYLSGAGTAYKLGKALVEQCNGPEWMHEDLLDFATIGTVADMVPLLGENRWMVRQGLQSMRHTQKQGLMSLIGVSGLKANSISSGDLGFMLGPRINAAGRLGSAMEAFDLLMSENLQEAGKLAQSLDNHNRERRSLTSKVAEEAEAMVAEDQEDANIILAFDQNFHAGVAGLAASKLVDRYYRPAIVGETGELTSKASCRSIPEFHMTDALQECADLFENFGGHAAAAGFTIKNENLEELYERLNLIADRELAEKSLLPSLQADIEIELGELKAEILDYLELVEPSGYGNQQVQFVSRNLKVASMRTVGADKSHLKLAVTDGWVTYDGIAFRQGHWAAKKPAHVDLLYRFELNEFNGRKNLQLNIQDIKKSAG